MKNRRGAVGNRVFFPPIPIYDIGAFNAKINIAKFEHCTRFQWTRFFFSVRRTEIAAPLTAGKREIIDNDISFDETIINHVVFLVFRFFSPPFCFTIL